MRRRLFKIGGAINRWVFIILATAQVSLAPGVARTELIGKPLPPKPLQTWVGISSWYGEKFQGRTTANGEIYDMYGATAAHLTLPLGSVVRVTCLRTGKSRIVRINDRGPFIDGREIDVSYEVARWLGFEENGIARVKIELLEVPERTWQRPRVQAVTQGGD